MRLIDTKHGLARKQQRAFRTDDFSRMLRAGTQISDEEVLVTNKDADREIHLLKQQIKHWERLRNRKLVLSGNRVITAYDAWPSHQTDCLRRARRLGNKA